jgi:predicted enzyme related to lactoylglutathione lyase
MSKIAAVMIHVTNVEAGLSWYQQAFPGAIRMRITDPIEFEYLDADGISIEIVPADEEVASGSAGSVVYWRVDDFDVALQRMQSIGATLYRGPRKIENQQRICQVRDPWGNCIGLRG